MANELVISEGELQIVKQCQSVMQTAYDDRVLVQSVATNIGLPDVKKYPNVAVNMADVLQIVRLASSMHLDPVMGGIWGYKDKNNSLVCGVTKKGWQQALHSQPDFQGITFKHSGELKQYNKSYTNARGEKVKLDFQYYDATTCIIKKLRPDGSIGEFEGTAYFDEECDLSKPTWSQRPKRMLDSRALTIAASNAYGWGAYDQEEAEIVTDFEKYRSNRVSVQPQKESKVIEASPKDNLIADMKRAVTRKELVAIFRSAPDELKEDADIVALGKELTEKLSKGN